MRSWVRCRPTSRAAPAGGASTSCFAATTRWGVLGGDPGVPWSVDVDPGEPPVIAASPPYIACMTVRPIIILGDPRLRLKGEPVDSFGKYLHELLDDLTHTMRAAPGVGLAAPQLGVALQACVVEVEDQCTSWSTPGSSQRRATTTTSRAACRSRATSPMSTRREQVWVVAQNRHGRKIKFAGSGLLSRAHAARARPPPGQAVHRLPRVHG